ncbi:MAG TPA: hypothetical protein VFZ17_12915 [Acidimicrobiia bacterium]|nr:hypothetical protein [Acidimicrobiia bacterium]
MPAPMTDAEQRRQRTTFAVVVVVAALVGIAFAAHAPDRSSPEPSIAAALVTTTSTPSTDTAPAAAGTATVAAPDPTSPPVTTVDPGSLPQTETEPTASGATWDAGVQALWQAIVHDNPAAGAPFFFPLSAYKQVKSIADPAGDYQQRLLANFADDVHSLHAQLGNDAATATFLGVDVPGGQAVWVQPGEEYNKLPYWRVYGTTLRYSVNGETHTMPVTSLISWRGEWYVVHLGAIH